MISRCLASRCCALSCLCLLRSDLLVLFISVTALCVRSAGLPACFHTQNEFFASATADFRVCDHGSFRSCVRGLFRCGAHSAAVEYKMAFNFSSMHSVVSALGSGDVCVQDSCHSNLD